jgi:hypothetical protein
MIVECPHCNCIIYISELNCKIFRHGVFKHNMEPIPPHSSKHACELYIKDNLIWGCGKPFQIKGNLAVECDYI